MGNINYSSLKTTSFIKFMGTMLIKPKEAQQQGPAEIGQPMCSSQQLKFT